jgi:glucose/arabinose dehydrogenase
LSTLIRPCYALLLAVLVPGTLPLSGQTFRVDTLARAPYAQYPVNIAFVPDGSGRFFFTEKNSGRVRIYQDRLLPDPFLTVPVESEGEQGLLGITCHPAYADSPFVFIFYVRAVDRLGIVERYRDSAGIGVEPRQILIVPRLDDATEHNGGALRFGPDRKLYVSVGDHKTSPWNAQDTSFSRIVWGKILRINTDGSIPRDNPSPRKAFWAWGLRNCEGMAFNPVDGALYCTDGGVGHPNRIFRVQRGGNMGWPRTAPPDPPDGLQPLVSFPAERSPALTGIAVYTGSAFPHLRGRLLVAGNATPSLWVSKHPADSDSLVLERFFTFPTGFADVQVGPDGCMYLTNGPYLSSKILRLSPVAPAFASIPVPEAVQGIVYSYTPVFTGTPPDLTVLEGPDGMTVDSASGRVLWTPTNGQAHSQPFRVTLGAQNGAGSTRQSFELRVINTNDPPGAFNLGMTAGAEVLNFLGTDPHVTFRWAQATDPDGDSLTYLVELDSTVSFDSPAHRVFSAGSADSLHVSLPRISGMYYWRVIATDGRLSTHSTPPYATMSIAFVPTPGIKVATERPPASPLEQNFPNPFNPSTSISYTIQRQGYVRLSVYNLLGQEVSRVFEGVQPEGKYTVAFNNLDLPSGIYFYRLQAPGLFETKKMIIAQ